MLRKCHVMYDVIVDADGGHIVCDGVVFHNLNNVNLHFYQYIANKTGCGKYIKCFSCFNMIIRGLYCVFTDRSKVMWGES